MWMELDALSHLSPIFGGDMRMTEKCPKFIYEYREQISYPPTFCPFLGDIANFAHFFFLCVWGWYWPILPSIMGKNGGGGGGGDKSFMLLARIICSSFPWLNLFILPWVQVHSHPSSPSSSSSSSSLRVRVGARYLHLYLYLYLGADFSVSVPVPVPVPASREQEVTCTCTCM